MNNLRVDIYSMIKRIKGHRLLIPKFCTVAIRNRAADISDQNRKGSRLKICRLSSFVAAIVLFVGFNVCGTMVARAESAELQRVLRAWVVENTRIPKDKESQDRLFIRRGPVR